jgi:hypothetical protein
MNRTMNRKEFLKLYTGIIGGLGIPGVIVESAHAADTKSGKGAALDDSYLVKGLTGMVRADGWFNAHWGAGILAGYYLCRDNHLGEETTFGIKKQLDAVIRLQAAQFAPLPEEPVDKALIEDVPKALLPAMRGGLRAHGHAVIFASLSVKALRDAPHMAQPALIKGLCGLSRQIAKIPPQKPPGPETSYDNTQAMIDATFDSLARFEGLLGRPSIRRPNFTHMVTHTDALMNLELMGYPELTKAGYAGHQAHIGAPVPEVDPATEASRDRASLEAVMSKGYWNDDRNKELWSRKWNEKDNPNGYWVAFGHLFKVLYSYHRLVSRVEDQEKVKLCSKILLERYVNPAVQGG